MTIARAQLVDTSIGRWYHCVTRCVRRAYLVGEGDHNRKEWLENRLEELAQVFAVAEGIAQARSQGKPHGRPITAAAHADEIKALVAQRVSKREIAKRLDTSRTSVRRLVA